jgi:hypothetical protein
MPNPGDYAVGAFVKFFVENEIVREEYSEQMPTVNGGALVLQSDNGALIIPVTNFTEIQVEYDFRPQDEATRIMLGKLGLSEEEIEKELARESDTASDSAGSEEKEANGPDSPVIRLDFGGSDEDAEGDKESS